MTDKACCTANTYEYMQFWVNITEKIAIILHSVWYYILKVNFNCCLEVKKLYTNTVKKKSEPSTLALVE